MLKHLTWRTISKSLLSCIVFYIFKFYILQDPNYIVVLSVLDIRFTNFEIDSDILSGIFTVITHYTQVIFIDNIFKLSTPLKVNVGNGIYTMDQDKVVGGLIEPSKNILSTQPTVLHNMLDIQLIDAMRKSFKGLDVEMVHLKDKLQSCNEHYKTLPSSFSMYNEGAIDIVTNHLKGQTEILNTYFKLKLI